MLFHTRYYKTYVALSYVQVVLIYHTTNIVPVSKRPQYGNHPLWYIGLLPFLLLLQKSKAVKSIVSKGNRKLNDLAYFGLAFADYSIIVKYRQKSNKTPINMKNSRLEPVNKEEKDKKTFIGRN